MNERILSLHNIGPIKEATICLDGLSVIAGENDTGKSTVAKILMALIKTKNISNAKKSKKDRSKYVSSEREFNILIKQLFDRDLKGESSAIINVMGNKPLYEVKIKESQCVKFESCDTLYSDCTFIQSPFMWDFYDFFKDVRLVNENAKIYGGGAKLTYPYLFWDLYLKMERSNSANKYEYIDLKKIKQEIDKVIKGHFAKQNDKTYRFYRDSQEISLKNVATGIKQFGILQVLLNSNWITPNRFLIFDEPENHLHPKWQLKFAEILVKLTALDRPIPIIVNSHSPNFIEAIYKYSIKHKAQANFHLADNGSIKKVISNEKTLELIFEKLNQPFEEFQQLDIEILKRRGI